MPDERLDPALSFADLTALCVTGPVEPGQTIRWTGFVNVPADGDYTFSVDCAESSPTTLFVDGRANDSGQGRGAFGRVARSAS